jgi:hypothetical protein
LIGDRNTEMLSVVIDSANLEKILSIQDIQATYQQFNALMFLDTVQNRKIPAIFM